MLADSCQFELLDVDALQDPASGRLLHLYSLVARCLSCETVFKAEEGQGLVSHTAARVVRCPPAAGSRRSSRRCCGLAPAGRCPGVSGDHSSPGLARHTAKLSAEANEIQAR
jgi:hypothetical protein